MGRFVQDTTDVTCFGVYYRIQITKYLTRWPEAFAMPIIDAQTIVSLLTDNILACSGAPVYSSVRPWRKFSLRFGSFGMLSAHP